jgi:xanthosine utilization system XapX-like protein
MDEHVIYGASGCFIGTLVSLILIQFNPQPILLILLPMWGLLMGISISRVLPTKPVAARKKR